MDQGSRNGRARGAGVLAGIVASAWGVGGVVAQDPADGVAGRVLAIDVDGVPPVDVVVTDGRRACVWFGRAGAPWFEPGPCSTVQAAPPLAAPVVVGDRLVTVRGGDALDPRPLAKAERFTSEGRVGTAEVWRVGTSLGPRAPDVTSMALTAAGNGDVFALWTEAPATPGIAVWSARLATGRIAAIAPLPVAGGSEVRIVGLHARRSAASPPATRTLLLERRGAGLQVLRLRAGAGPAPAVVGQVWLTWFPDFEVPVDGPLDALGVVGRFAPDPAFALPFVRPRPQLGAVLHGSNAPPWIGTDGAAVRWPEGSRVRPMAESAADYDGDGDDEVALAVVVDGTHEWLAVVDPHPLGDSVTIAPVPGEPDADGTRVAGVLPLDVDGDGLPELLVSWRPEPGTARLDVLGVDGTRLVGAW